MLRSRQDWAGMAEVLQHVHECSSWSPQSVRWQAVAAIRLVDEDLRRRNCHRRTWPSSLSSRQWWPRTHGVFDWRPSPKRCLSVVLCREPTTRLGEIPIAAIAPGATVRVRIDPPKSETKPSASWFRSAIDALSQREAIAMDQPDLEVSRRIDRLLCLDRCGPRGRCTTRATDTGLLRKLPRLPTKTDRAA